MKSIYIITILTLLPLIVHSKNSIDSLLRVLDITIENTQIFNAKKEHSINTLKRHLEVTSSERLKYDLTFKLYREYRSYKYDSAYNYAERMLKYAEEIKDPNLISESKIALAFSCVSAGLYKEATEISNSIDSTNIDSINKADFYSFLSILNLNMSDFAATEPYYSAYRAKSLMYCRNSLKLYPQSSPEFIKSKMLEAQLLDNYTEAIFIAEHYLSVKPSDLHFYAIAISSLGFFYEVKGDTTNAIECFAKAAIADIEMAVKETSAIRQLAELLFLRGDLKHAYSYAMLALDDANFYNARHRKIEVGRTLPIIEAGRFAIIEQQKDKLLVFSALITMLFILFVAATLIILKQKKRLNAARDLILKQNAYLKESNEQLIQVQKKIKRQNTELLHINKQLKEAHHIKDEYLGFFFSINSAYLEKREEYNKMVARRIKNRQFEELFQEIAAFDLRKEKEDMFTLFDQIFMKIFPDFVDRYNLLFKEEDHFHIKSDGILSPEIRIFALIRLGITDSERIARLLGYSLSTVKNYKSKAKNRSFIPNELFEQNIMAIDSVNTEFQEIHD